MSLSKLMHLTESDALQHLELVQATNTHSFNATSKVIDNPKTLLVCVLEKTD